MPEEEQDKLHHVVTMENLGGLKRKLTIISDIEIVKTAMKRACNIIGKQVQIKGFRRGKAPDHLVDLYHPDDVKAAASSILSQEAFFYACFEQKIEPLGEPKIEKADFEMDGTFCCEIHAEIKPEIIPSGYVGMQLTRPKMDEEHIFEDVLGEAKSQHMVETQVKEVTLGSVATVNFWVQVDGKEITKGEGNNFMVAEGQEPPFGENLVGMKVGEMKSEKITLPEGHEHAGKEADVRIELIVATERREPNDEELVEKMQAPSHEELMELFKKDAKQRAENQVRQVLEEQVVDKLVETHEFEVPEQWVEDEEKHTYGQLQASQPDEETKKRIKEMAERNIRRSFILEAIYKAENMKVTQEELDLVIKSEAERLNMGRLALQDHIQKEGLMDGVIAAIKHRKVFDLILNQAQIETEEEPVEEAGDNCEIPENPLG